MIRRNTRRQHWVTIDRDVVRDTRLSWKARGLLAYLLSQDDNWEISVRQLVKASPNDKETALRSAFKELVDVGYARIVYTRTADNARAAGKHYDVDEIPAPMQSHSEMQVSSTSENLNFRNSEVQKTSTSENLKYRNSEVQKTCTIKKDLKEKKDLETKKDLPPTPQGRDADVGEAEQVTQHFKPRSAKKQPNTFYTPAFDRMWNVWPAGRKIGKVDTFTIWRDRGLEPRADEIIGKLERLKITLWRGKEPKYIPMPETWFHKSRYEDEIVPLDVESNEHQGSIDSRGARNEAEMKNSISRLVERTQDYEARRCHEVLPGTHSTRPALQ